MTTIRILSVALIVSSMTVTAAAQQHPAASASAAMAAASMPHDCARSIARHDHGAERGAPMPRSMSGPCAPARAASAPKAKPVHDHAKFHKNQ